MEKLGAPVTEFQILSGESILIEIRPNRKWYAIAWKVIIGILAISMLTLIANAVFVPSIRDLFTNFIPAGIAAFLVQFLCLGLTALLGLVWVVEDIARAFNGRCILTDRRLWFKGSPYAWNQGEIPLDDIDSMTYRRDAIFIRQKSTRRLQVHMFPGGKLLVQAYEKLRGKSGTG